MLNKIKNLFSKLRQRRLARNTAIILYGIFEKKDPDFSGPSTPHPSPIELMQHYTPVTIAPTREDAMKVIDKLIYFNHFDHFALWCDSHGYTDTCAWTYPSWTQYKRDVLTLDTIKTESEKYSAFALTYSRKDISSIIRMFSHCEPLLLPYEKDVELQAYLNRTPILSGHLASIIAADTVDGAKIKNAITQIQKITETQPSEKNLEEN